VEVTGAELVAGKVVMLGEEVVGVREVKVRLVEDEGDDRLYTEVTLRIIQRGMMVEAEITRVNVYGVIEIRFNQLVLISHKDIVNATITNP